MQIKGTLKKRTENNFLLKSESLGGPVQRGVNGWCHMGEKHAKRPWVWVRGSIPGRLWLDANCVGGALRDSDERLC